MRTVDIKVFKIAQSRMNWNETRDWLDHIGAENTDVPFTDGQRDLAVAAAGGEIEQEAEVSDAGAVCSLCAKRCYMSFEEGLNPNITKVRKAWHTYLNNILKSRHGSVLEHSTWTWAIEGVSRVFTGEMNRHRAGVAISEGSMRYIRFDDIPFWLPNSLQPGNKTLKDPAVSDVEFETRKAATTQIIKYVFEEVEHNYKYLCDIWHINDLPSFSTKKKLTSLFRRIIPMGVATGGTWTFNGRALRHIIALRTAEAAEEEIAYVVGLIAKRMCEEEPALFGDFEEDPETGVWTPKYEKV